MMLIGFRDEIKLVRAFAARMKTHPLFATVSRYRAGELALLGPSHAVRTVMVVTNITEDPTTLFRAGLLAEALRDQGARRVILIAPWIAYGRQDRATRAGEAAAGRVVGRLLATLFDRIVTLDAHSAAFIKTFRGTLRNVIPMRQSARRRDRTSSLLASVTCVAAPDHGASTRAKHLAEALGVPCFVVEKQRVRGHVRASRLVAREQALRGAHALLVDDIADSGETLAAAACVLRAAGAATVSAYVTHAINLARLRRAHHRTIRHTDAAFDHETGRMTLEAIQVLCDAVKV